MVADASNKAICPVAAMRALAGIALFAMGIGAAGCGSGGAGASGGDGAGSGAGKVLLGGVVSGLGQGQSVVLLNRGADALTVSGNGAFSFASALVVGTTYDVTVGTQPNASRCLVTNGQGTAGADSPAVVVTCSATTGAGGPDIEPAPVLNLAVVTGDWLQNLCAPFTGGTSVKNLVRVVALTGDSVDYRLGIQQFGNTTCAGPGTVLASPSSLGTVRFDNVKANSTLLALFGTWTAVTSVSRVAWAIKGGQLCTLGDAIPSVFPTAASVEATVDLPGQASSCYQRPASTN